VWRQGMSESPKRVWMDPDIHFPECEKQYLCDIGYVREDLYEELEAKLKWVIEERDNTFALMLKRAEAAEAKLATAVEALENISYGGAYTDMQIARATLAELKDDICV